MKTIFAAMAIAATSLMPLAASAAEITVYSGRGESFTAPMFKLFEEQTGIKVNARYGTTAELSALLREEGDKSPADLFLAQDAASLVSNEAIFAPMPADLSAGVLAGFKPASDKWIGTSGRARTMVYSVERVSEAQFPKSVYDLTAPEWKGKVGFAPGNASFQAFLTAVRVVDGEEKARQFVQGLVANDAKTYKNNTDQLQAIADGEVDVALVNNYYLTRFKLRDAKFPVAQTFFQKGDIGNLMFTSGAGVPAASDNQEAAHKLIGFLLSPAAQQYFSASIGEYPVTGGVIPNDTLGAVADPAAFAPKVEIEALADTDGTKKLLTELGLI
jgi:iron(III) transport system substrate-binding protein